MSLNAESITSAGGPGAIAERARRRDGELVRRCRGGDQGAWDALVDRFSSYVYAILIRGFELRPAAADDVFQDVFTTVFRRLETLADDEAVKPWIAQLTRRAAIDRISATRVEVDLDSLLEATAVDRELDLIEEAMSVHDALAELPAPYRDVVERFFIQDQSYRVIADELGIASGTIASRISRGLAMLRSLLEDQSAPAAEVSVGHAHAR
jgi:RNA polymerase sigma-70 factor (ECF subfamily)